MHTKITANNHATSNKSPFRVLLWFHQRFWWKAVFLIFWKLKLSRKTAPANPRGGQAVRRSRERRTPFSADLALDGRTNNVNRLICSKTLTMEHESFTQALFSLVLCASQPAIEIPPRLTIHQTSYSIHLSSNLIAQISSHNDDDEVFGSRFLVEFQLEW